jgi:bacillithiol biosynthesis deacetylase BshB1
VPGTTTHTEDKINRMKADILAFGVHPDDVELSCSGTLINEIRNGKTVVVVDLTEGELGTRGSVETRYAEAASAAMIMGIQARENLKMKDGFLQNDEAHQRKIIQIIRKYQPSIVLANSLSDRHPDHGKAGRLVADSCFLAGLAKIETLDELNNPQHRWRPTYVLHYIQDRLHEPDVVIDISAVFDQRMEAIKAYTTQFHSDNQQGDAPQTYISTPAFSEGIIARARLMGKRIGVNYAEGFTAEKSIGLKNLDALVQIET